MKALQESGVSQRRACAIVGLRIFSFEFLQASQIARLKTGVLFFPKADRIRGDAVSSAKLRCWRAGLKFFKYPNDLSFAEAGILHGEVPLGALPEISPFQLVRICPLRSGRIYGKRLGMKW